VPSGASTRRGRLGRIWLDAPGGGAGWLQSGIGGRGFAGREVPKARQPALGLPGAVG